MRIGSWLSWAAIHLPFALTLLAPCYLCLGTRVEAQADWIVLIIALSAVVWALFLVFVAPSAWPVGGHTVFCLYLSIIIGFASVYHLSLMKRLTLFRIDQELDLEEVRLTREVRDLDLRLRYLANIYTANEHGARVFGAKQMLQDVEHAYKTEENRAFLALFGGSDESVKDLPLSVIEKEYADLSGIFRYPPKDLSTMDLDDFRQDIKRAAESNYSDMASVVESYWQTKGDEMLRIPFDKVLRDLEDLFQSLEAAKRELHERAYSREAYLNMLYFSFVVGSTLGFGDIVPNGPVIRSFVILELMSTMFVVVIAVNRWSQRSSAKVETHDNQGTAP